MQEGKLYFWDTAGKFDAVKEALHDVCRTTYDLTVYSLTPKGSETPSRLVLKMTVIGNPEGYLSTRRVDVEEAFVSMASLDYRAFPVDWLKRICENMKRMADFERKYIHTAGFKKYIDEERYLGVTVEEFFRTDPETDHPGAQIYLRDKAHFMSMLPDPARVDFRALPLLTNAQKAMVTAIDTSYADISGRTDLSRLFCGYKSVSELDLSALDTAGVTDMQAMFFECQNLRRLDLSTFDFSWVKNLRAMFSGCRNLQEVILSDTVLSAGGIPHAAGGYEEVLRSNYNLSGPHPSHHDYSLEPKTIEVSVREATLEELVKHLGLPASFANAGLQKLRIVPHRALKR